MLQVRDLYCERQRRILFEDLSFTVQRQEILQIRGNNGSGKTTLLKILSGLYGDYTGKVDWQLESWPLFIGHKPGVKDQLTAGENLAWLAGLHRSDVGASELDGALEAVALSGYEDVACGSLSEGQRKRVNLARLFIIHSPVWILDEPLSAIDAQGVNLLQDLMARHMEDDGTVILTSHQALEVNCEVNYLDLTS